MRKTRRRPDKLRQKRMLGPLRRLWGVELDGRTSLEVGGSKKPIQQSHELGLRVVGSEAAGPTTVGTSGLGEVELRLAG